MRAQLELAPTSPYLYIPGFENTNKLTCRPGPQAVGVPHTATQKREVKAGQTEFAVYRHRPHGFSGFPKIFEISDAITANMQYFEPHPSSALISGRGLGDLDLVHNPFSSLYQFEI